MGLVTAEEFRKAREAAEHLEEAEARKRQEKEVNWPRVVDDRCLWATNHLLSLFLTCERCAGYMCNKLCNIFRRGAAGAP